MSKNKVNIRISQSGIKLENPVFDREISWDEVSEVDAFTTWDKLEISDSGGLPFEIAEAELVIGNSTPKNGVSSSPKNDEGVERDSLWDDIEDRTGIAHNHGKSSVDFPEGKPSSTVFRNLLSYLMEEDLFSKEDLPWSYSTNAKHYLLNTVPKNKRGGDMPSPVEIMDGIFLYTKPPKENMERYFKEFVEDIVQKNEN